MIDENDIFELLAKNELQLPPLEFRLIALEPTATGAIRAYADVLYDVVWEGKQFRFVAECKSVGTPKMILAASEQIERVAADYQAYPMVIVPYLSEDQLNALENKQRSGVDLCGNGTIHVTGQFLVRRSGQPNRYPQSTPIRNVYQGQSSLIGRVFMARPRYKSVNEVLAEILRRNGLVTLSTVSKVLRTLEEDLFTARDKNGFRLLQPDALLESLKQNFREPRIRERILVKGSSDQRENIRLLRQAAVGAGSQLVMTGASTGMQLAIAGRDPMLSFFCSRPPRDLLAASSEQLKETERFANFELLWTGDTLPYFDAQIDSDSCYASLVQAYLEMANGDKRLKDLSTQIRGRLMVEIQRADRSLDAPG